MKKNSTKKHTPFDRKFAIEHIRDHYAEPRSLIRALFDRWTVPGQGTINTSVDAKHAPVRLALRDNYLNFYVNGQSVGKLSAGSGEPHLEISRVYFEKASQGYRDLHRDSGYVKLGADDLLLDKPQALLDELIEIAGEKSGKEKRFVEHVMAANHNVLEVEMALPGDYSLASCMKKRENKLVAPRMDVVVAHQVAEGGMVIDFWEAKLATNGELRATLPENGGTKEPHVSDQLTDYMRWIKINGRARQVCNAFNSTGKALSALASMAGKTGPAVDLWHDLSQSKVAINPRPGILIGNYDPKCRNLGMFACRKSFSKHRTRLEKHDNPDRCFVIKEVDGIDPSDLAINVPLPGERL